MRGKLCVICNVCQFHTGDQYYITVLNYSNPDGVFNEPLPLPAKTLTFLLSHSSSCKFSYQAVSEAKTVFFSLSHNLIRMKYC